MPARAQPAQQNAAAKQKQQGLTAAQKQQQAEQKAKRAAAIDARIADLKRQIAGLEQRAVEAEAARNTGSDPRLAAEADIAARAEARLSSGFRVINNTVLAYSEGHLPDPALARELLESAKRSPLLVSGFNRLKAALSDLRRGMTREQPRQLALSLESLAETKLVALKGALAACLSDYAGPSRDLRPLAILAGAKAARAALYVAASFLAENALAASYAAVRDRGKIDPPDARWFAVYFALFAAAFDAAVLATMFFMIRHGLIAAYPNCWWDVAVDAAAGLAGVALTALAASWVVGERKYFNYRDSPERALEAMRALTWVAAGVHVAMPYGYMLGPRYMRAAQSERRQLLARSDPPAARAAAPSAGARPPAAGARPPAAGR